MDCVSFCLNRIQAVRGSRHSETGSNYRGRASRAGEKSLNKSHFRTPTFRLFFFSSFWGSGSGSGGCGWSRVEEDEDGAGPVLLVLLH